MQLPARIGKYEIVELLAHNMAAAAIYKAYDSVTGLVALLVAREVIADAYVRERMLREAPLLRMLQHPNILVAHETGDIDGRPYIAYEFLDGEPLDSVIRTGTTLTLLQKLDIILQVSEALQYVHTKGIIHHDVKPSNIMLLRDGKVKLVGFEAACPAGQAIPKHRPIVGTLPFMSPEMLLGHCADQRSDIFSLGVTFYQLMDGDLPFEGATQQALITKILHEQPLQSHEARDLRLLELQAIFDKALAKETDLRYKSCSDFREDLIRLRQRLELGAAPGSRD